MWGRGPIGSNGACSTLCQISVTSPTTHNQIGPFWCSFLGGWPWVCSRTLWVSPTNSPVKVGVFPADASTPQGVQLVVWGFISSLWKSGSGDLSRGSTSDCLARQLQLCPARSTILHLAGSSSHRLATRPICLAACLHPSYWSGWMFLLYLLGCPTSIQFNFLSVMVAFCF